MNDCTVRLDRLVDVCERLASDVDMQSTSNRWKQKRKAMDYVTEYINAAASS
jgi:hypothetical protein